MRILTILFFFFFANVLPVSAMSRSFLPGKFQFKSYLHVRYSFVENDARNKVSEDHWNLRRFKLAADWQINQKASFCAQAIYKKNNYSATDDDIFLQHAYLKFFIDKFLNLKIGQFKPPFGWERFQPDYQLPTVERSQAIDRLIPNGSLGESFVRDYGAQLLGKLAFSFQYELALQSGTGANMNFTDKNFPLITARLSYRRNLNLPTMDKEFRLLSQVAYSYRKNKSNNFAKQLPGCNITIFQNFSGEDRRMDVALVLTAAKMQFAAEFLSAQFLPDAAALANVRANGWFCEYSRFVSDCWQAVLRYEHFDPDMSKKNLYDLSWVTIGVEYYFNTKADRLMLNYIHKNEAQQEVKNDMIVIQLQYFLFGKRK